jgi:hypothetical protein
MHPNIKTTLLRAASNYATPDQDVKFAHRYQLTHLMRAGCRLAVRSVMAAGEGVFELGLERPVRVTVDSRIHGQVHKAIGLIAYRDDSFDSLFFVFESRSGELMAVMGDSYDVSRAIDGWLEYDRYFDFSFDLVARQRADVFQVDGFETIWADDDGIYVGADIEGSVASVSKTHVHDSYARLPEYKLLRIGVQASLHRASKGFGGGVNAR